MKRFSVRWILATVLAGTVLLCAAGYACASLIRDAGNLTYDMRGQTGDAHAADGLKITKKYFAAGGYKSEFWIGENAFRYENGMLNRNSRMLCGYLNEKEMTEVIYRNGGIIGPRLCIEVDYTKLSEELEKTYGVDGSVLVNVKDYYTYYPLSWEIYIPNFDYYDSRSYECNLDEGFQEVFRIPVLEKEKYGMNYNYQPQADDFYRASAYSYLESVGNDSEIWFFIRNQTAGGEQMDMTGLRDGYGIYRIPYRIVKDGNEKKIEADSKEISLFYSLPNDIVIRSLSLTADGSVIFLYTEENEQTVLTVIDAKTGEKLAGFAFGDAYWGYLLYGGNLRENFAVVYDDGVFHVIARSDAGQWEDRLRIPVAGAVNTSYSKMQQAQEILHPYDYTGSQLAYDGNGRLAVVAYADYKERLSVTILTEDGVKYTDVMELSVEDAVPFEIDTDNRIMDTVTVEWK